MPSTAPANRRSSLRAPTDGCTAELLSTTPVAATIPTDLICNYQYMPQPCRYPFLTAWCAVPLCLTVARDSIRADALLQVPSRRRQSTHQDVYF